MKLSIMYSDLGILYSSKQICTWESNWQPVLVSTEDPRPSEPIMNISNRLVYLSPVLTLVLTRLIRNADYPSKERPQLIIVDCFHSFLVGIRIDQLWLLRQRIHSCSQQMVLPESGTDLVILQF